MLILSICMLVVLLVLLILNNTKPPINQKAINNAVLAILFIKILFDAGILSRLH